MEPTDDVKVLMLQLEHAVSPLRVLNVPTPHGAHNVAEAANVPASHATQTLAPPLLMVPFMHAVQELAF